MKASRSYDRAVKLASLDWRDLFMAAGVREDVDAYHKWYKEIVDS